MLPRTISFVDLETTGSRFGSDRIIEIGIVRVENNRVVKKFQSLVNPETYLPPFIEQMTGIHTADLESAPSFRSIKDEVLELLSDSLFVAHNVRFDYGFLRSEFKRMEKTFSSKHLCTVKLFRSLYPQLQHHNLDALIQHFGFRCENRHRAFDDAHVLWQFYKNIQKTFTVDTLTATFEQLLKKPSLPPGLSADALDKLPEECGVYIFYDAEGMPLYVGKSVNIRDRVMSHFASDHTSTRELRISQQIKSIETHETDSELEALIVEASLVKKMQPVYNRMLRSKHELVVIKRKSTANYEQAEIDRSVGLEADHLDSIMSIHRSAKQAKSFLHEIAEKYALCPRLLGLEKGKGACFSYHLGKCRGACAGKEETLRYNLRFLEAFAKYRVRQWPFPGPIVVENKFVIDKWCLQDYGFDWDNYKILAKYLLDPHNQRKIKLVSSVSPQEVFPF